MSTPEDIREDGKRDAAEDKRREFLEQRSRMGGPDAPEPCEECEGKGAKLVNPPNDCDFVECPRCLGTGVQP